MSYTPKDWADGPQGGTPIMAADLDHLETQYDQAIKDSVQVKEAPLTPYRFDAVPPVSGSDNTAALTAMFQAAAGSTYTGSEIYFPPGLWRTTHATPWTLASNMVIRGTSKKSRVVTVTTAGDMFSWNAGISGVRIQDIWLESAAAGSHIFAPGASGGISQSVFDGLYLAVTQNDRYIYNQVNGASFIHNTFRDCELNRPVGGTVPAINIVNSGGAANFNLFEQVRFNGNNNVTTPFMHVESTLPATFLTDWTFINILGEQNPGGLIRALGAYNWTVINATDEDSTVDYAGNILDFQANGSGLAPRDITVMNSGRRGRAMASGKYELYVDTNGSGVVVMNCNPTPTSGTAKLSLPRNSTVLGTRGYPLQLQGAGTPEGGVTAVIGSVYARTDGTAGATFYVKESGTGNTGWVGK